MSDGNTLFSKVKFVLLLVLISEKLILKRFELFVITPFIVLLLCFMTSF